MFREERNYLPSITRGQVRQDQISGDSAERERSQKVSCWILHGACRKQKGRVALRKLDLDGDRQADLMVDPTKLEWSVLTNDTIARAGQLRS
jgi:hypothetical protein